MNIVVTHTEPSLASSWQRALAERLPQAKVRLDADEFTTPNTGTDSRSSANTDASADAGTDASAAQYGVGWQPPEDFFIRHRHLRAFFSAAAGVEHVLRNPALPPDLPIIRLEDAGMSVQMIEYCCQAVFRLRTRSEQYEQQQVQKRWQELTPIARGALRIGVFGLGVLGASVAAALVAFGYTVSGYARTPRELAGVRCYSGAEHLPEFLARCDALILLAPLTPETRGVFNATTLAWLPRGAYLINVARGGLIDDTALLSALDSGHLGGASLDVFNTEPLPPEHPYWTHPRVRVTPHISAITEVNDSADQVVAKLIDFQAGHSVSGMVDRRRGY
jgi:glyoxylate/hydroxypyruvate reductase